MKKIIAGLFLMAGMQWVNVAPVQASEYMCSTLDSMASSMGGYCEFFSCEYPSGLCNYYCEVGIMGSYSGACVPN